MEFYYTDYISFEVTPWAENPGRYAPGQVGRLEPLSGNDLIMVKNALTELAETAEGRDLIMRAAAMSETGFIHIVNNGGGVWASENGHVLIGGNTDTEFQTRDGYLDFFSMTIQRSLFHEIYHLTQPAVDEERHMDGIHQPHEEEAVAQTNIFMRRYYNEPERNNYNDTQGLGTPEIDYNPDFRAQGYRPDYPEISLFGLRHKIGNIPSWHIGNFDPEIQSLYEHRDNHELFVREWDRLVENGSIELIQEQLDFLTSGEGDEVQPREAPVITYDAPGPQ